MKVPAEFIHVGFIDLLCDAIFHYRHSADSKESYAVNRNARASITASFLSIESCANILLQSLDISKKMRNDLDRLPALSKMEAYSLLENVSCNFDRGDNRVQKVSELIQARNDFVHPKSRNISSDIGEPQDGGDVWILPMGLEGVQYKELKIPKCALFWNADNSFSVLKTVFDFYEYIFEKLVPIDDKKSHLLLNRVEFENVIMPNTFSEFDMELSKAKELGINTAWIEKRIST